VETLAALAHGFGVALTPVNLVFAFIGAVLGTAVGVLPGVGPALTVALLLPVTYNLAPTASFIMFAGEVTIARRYGCPSVEGPRSITWIRSLSFERSR